MVSFSLSLDKQSSCYRHVCVIEKQKEWKRTRKRNTTRLRVLCYAAGDRSSSGILSRHNTMRFLLFFPDPNRRWWICIERAHIVHAMCDETALHHMIITLNHAKPNRTRFNQNQSLIRAWSICFVGSIYVFRTSRRRLLHTNRRSLLSIQPSFHLVEHLRSFFWTKPRKK